MMFKTRSYNTTTSGSSKNESAFAVSSSCARLILDTVIAVSIFAILAIISSVSVLAVLNVVILAVLSVVIVAIAVLLAAVIIESTSLGRPEPVKVK